MMKKSELRLIALVAGAGLVASTAMADLANRYNFNANANDSVGGQNGTVRQVSSNGVPLGVLPTFDGTGVSLDGLGGYVDLPNGLISTKTNVTLEMWINVIDNQPEWSRMIDFGSITIISNDLSTGDFEDTDGSWITSNTVARTSVFTTPHRGGSGGGAMRAAATDRWYFAGAERPILDDALPFGAGFEAHLVITYGEGGMRMFYDGLQTGAGFPDNFVELSNIVDVNNWLGRSQYSGDPRLNGVINEFRIYDHLMTAQEVMASYTAGPDVGDPNANDPGAVVAGSLTLSAANNMVLGFTQPALMTAQFANVGVIDVYPPDIDSFSSSNPLVVDADRSGTLTAVGTGSAIISATFSGVTRTVTINVTKGVSELKNRWSFNEAAGATMFADTVGGKNGTIFGTNYAVGDGTILLNSGTPGYQAATYVDLPDGVISSRTNITIESWFTWVRGNNGLWQRIFDFGASAKAGGIATNSGSGTEWLSFGPNSSGNNMRLLFSTNGNPVQLQLDGPACPVNQQVHVAIVYAGEANLSRIFFNGVAVASGVTPAQLYDLSDTNNWLGVSNWDDTPFGGRLNEFRIYEGVLTDLDIALHRHAGPDDVDVGDPGALLSIDVPNLDFMIGSTPSSAQILATFENYTNVQIQGISGTSFVGTDTNIYTITAVGAVTPINVGQADLIGRYLTLVDTGKVSVLNPIALRLSTNNIVLNEGFGSVQVNLLADFPNSEVNGYTNVNVNAFAGVTRTPANTNVAISTAGGAVWPVGPGATTITYAYGGLTVDLQVAVAPLPSVTPGTLIHRYSFSEAVDSTTVEDLVGDADGTVIGIAAGTDNNNFNGTGQLALSGGGNSGAPTGAYVDLPNGLVSGLSAVTIEGWLTWRGGNDWQRIFDFGMSSRTNALGEFLEGIPSVNPGRSYMFLAPRSTGDARPAFAIKQGTGAETPNFRTYFPIVVNQPTHFAVVYDPANAVVRQYLNGRYAGFSTNVSLPLSVLDDRNVWIGASNWVDPMLNAILDEFRIWNGPLNPSDVAANYAAGPNVVVTPVIKPTMTVKLVGANVVITWPTNSTGFTLEGSAALGSGASWSSAGLPAPTVDGANYQVTVSASGTDNKYFRLKK